MYCFQGFPYFFARHVCSEGKILDVIREGRSWKIPKK